MYARVMTYQVKPDQKEERVRYTREVTRPKAKQTPGWKGVLLLNDPATHKQIAISLWETKADMLAVERNEGHVTVLPHHKFAQGEVTFGHYEVQDFEVAPY